MNLFVSAKTKTDLEAVFFEIESLIQCFNDSASNTVKFLLESRNEISSQILFVQELGYFLS